MPKYGKCLKAMKRGGQVLKILPVLKGTAAQANKGAKGSAFGRIMAGDSCVLLSQQGPGSLTVFG